VPGEWEWLSTGVPAELLYASIWAAHGPSKSVDCRVIMRRGRMERLLFTALGLTAMMAVASCGGAPRPAPNDQTQVTVEKPAAAEASRSPEADAGK
jgi:hypothetical protein